MKTLISILFIFIFFTAVSQETNGEIEKSKSFIFSEMEYYFYTAFPFPGSYITFYETEVLKVKKFSTDFLVGFGFNSIDSEIFFAPAFKTGIQFAYLLKNRHRIYAGGGNLFAPKHIYGKVRLGYQYLFAERFVVSLSVENFVWVNHRTYSYSYYDDDGNLMDKYQTKYNIWGWDNEMFTVNLGFGIKF